MQRKAVTRRLEVLATMCSAIRTCGATVVDHLAGRPAAPGGAAASYRLILEHMHAELLALESQLEIAEGAYVASQQQLEKCKSRRDQALSSLEHRVREVKRFLTGFFQPHDLVRAGVGGATPRSAIPLCRHITATVDFLRRLDATVTPPILDISFDHAAMAGDLEAGADQLKAAITALDTARFEIESSRAQTRDALAAVKRVAPWIARLLECLGQLAGEPMVPPA